MSCPECISGHTHEGKPGGSARKIYGLDTYVTEPPGGAAVVKGIVIIITDAFGWEFNNVRLLADHYAASGEYMVYIPDFMEGHAMSTDLMNVVPSLKDWSTPQAWISKPYWVFKATTGMIPFSIFNSFARTLPRVQEFFRQVRLNEGAALPMGAVGFCWGGKHAIHLSHGTTVDGGQGSKPLVDAVFTGHPSLLTLPRDVEGVRKPLSIAVGDKDVWLTAEGITTVRSVFDGLGDVPREIVVFPNAGHGFTVRQDTKNPEQERQAREAQAQALSWFARHFAAAGYGTSS